MMTIAYVYLFTTIETGSIGNRDELWSQKHKLYVCLLYMILVIHHRS